MRAMRAALAIDSSTGKRSRRTICGSRYGNKPIQTTKGRNAKTAATPSTPPGRTEEAPPVKGVETNETSYLPSRNLKNDSRKEEEKGDEFYDWLIQNVGKGLADTQKKARSTLSNLKAAVLDLSAIAILSAVGTVIEQGKNLEYYQQYYPDGDGKVLGFVTWKLIITLGLDHVYTSPIFFATLVYLAASLVVCSSTTQLPLLKRAKKWNFLDGNSIADLPLAEDLPRGKVEDLGKLLSNCGYQVFLQNKQLYGFKGLAGRYAPIWVHVSLILIMIGGSCSALGGLRGDLLIPEEQGTVIAEGLRPIGPFPFYPSGAGYGLYLDQFDIKYRPSGKVEQYFSTLSVLNDNGDILYSKKISVNDPLRWKGVTMYQTDWSIAAVQLTVKDATGSQSTGSSFRLPFATLENGEAGVGGRIWATLLPTGETGEKKGVSILARDLQSVALYKEDGTFAGVRRPGSNNPIVIDGVEVVVDKLIGSSGIEFRSDPGVPIVYAGFGMLMMTTIVSCFSHSQVWAAEYDSKLRVGGKANRGFVNFANELEKVLDTVP